MAAEALRAHKVPHCIVKERHPRYVLEHFRQRVSYRLIKIKRVRQAYINILNRTFPSWSPTGRCEEARVQGGLVPLSNTFPDTPTPPPSPASSGKCTSNLGLKIWARSSLRNARCKRRLKISSQHGPGSVSYTLS